MKLGRSMPRAAFETVTTSDRTANLQITGRSIWPLRNTESTTISTPSKVNAWQPVYFSYPILVMESGHRLTAPGFSTSTMSVITCGGVVQCCQPSRPSEIPPGRTGRRQGRQSRPYSRRTECRRSSTVIGRLLFIFRRDPIEPNNVIQASECMKFWVQRA